MNVTKKIKEKLSSVKPAKANIVPLTKEMAAKINNPDILALYKKAGYKSEFFTTTGVECGLSGLSKGEALAQGLIPFIPKLFSNTIENEQLRNFPMQVMGEFILEFAKDYNDKTPVVIINNKNDIGEVSSSTIILGEKTLVFYKNLAKHKNFEENGRTRESFSLMVESVNGEQISPTAVLTNALKYDIDKNGEVFLTQDGMECNIGEDGRIIAGTEKKIEGPTDEIPEENIRINNGKEAIATGCSVQVGANGDKYLAGGEDMLVLAMKNMKDQATFIKPVVQATERVEASAQAYQA